MVVLKVDGMSCGHCTAAVEKALKALPGVTGVDVSLDAGEARVEGGADTEAMIAAIVEEGYTARLAD